MTFTDAEKVQDVIWRMKLSDIPRSQNRAKIDLLFNGDTPWTEQEALEQKVQINVNFLEGAKIVHDARGAYENAFLKPGNYFTVTLDSGSVHKRSTWARQITKRINRCMKKSAAYMDTIRATGANVILHGIGPVMWEDRYKWCPAPIGVEDVLVPSGTRVALDNLSHFAVFRQYTQAHLFRMTHGDKVDPGWNMGVVREQLARIKKEDGQTTNSYRDLESPEKLVERYRQNLGFYESDATPTVDCWIFPFQDDDGNWQRKIVLDYDSKDGADDRFLYSSKRIYAKNLSNILHVQFADGANVAPFKYHSIRSLGYMLYAVCRIQNRLRGRFLEAALESMNWYFRCASAEDRERLEKVDLFHQGIIPQGVEWVPANERFIVREQLVESALSQGRQSMSENSSSFTQDVNDGTQKELTATEVMARTSAAAGLVSSMLNRAYNYQTFQYREICRRFCIKDSNDPSVIKFRKECLEQDDIPADMLDVEKWNIEPERVLGAGNKQLEIAQANQLMAARNLYDPEPQREILHIFTEAMTDDPQLADRLVPIEKKQVSDSVHDAELAFAPLMMGANVSVKTGMNHIEYIETLIRSISSIIARIEATTHMATQEEIIGFQNVAQHIGQHIQILAQDKNEKQRVKQYGDTLGKLMNMVKAYAQRLQEQQAQQQGGNGGLPAEDLAKIQSATIIAQTNAKIKEAKAAQQMQHKDMSFQAGEQRKNVQLQQDLQRQMAETQTDIAATDLTTQAEIIRQGRKPQKPPTQ